MADCCRKGLNRSYIKSGLSAISFMHKISKSADPTKSFRVNRMLKGLGVKKSKKPKLLPINLEFLQKILIKLSFCSNVNLKVALKAILLLAYYGCMRIGELVETAAGHQIRTENLRFKTIKGVTNLKITLKSYKHSSEEATFLVPAIGGEFCPVKAIENFLLLRGAHAGTVFVNPVGKPYTRAMVAKHLKENIGALGRNPIHYNTHSLRIARVTQMALAGVPVEVIKRTGRWKSNAFMKYVRFESFSVPPS